MKQVLTELAPVPFLNPKATEFLGEARQWFAAASLSEHQWRIDGGSILLFGWLGDTVHDTLALLLTARGLHASNEGAAIRVFSTDQARFLTVLGEIGNGSVPEAKDLQIKPENAIREKWDWALPAELRLRSYISSHLDMTGAQNLARAILNTPDSAAP
jgi:ATP-dependent Lhr-like helicase